MRHRMQAILLLVLLSVWTGSTCSELLPDIDSTAVQCEADSVHPLLSAVPVAYQTALAEHSFRRPPNLLHHDVADVGIETVTGPQATVVILVKFTDRANVETRSSVWNRVFGDLNDYFQEVSFNKISLTGEISPNWHLLGHSVEYYGAGDFAQEKHWKLAEDAFAAADSVFDYNDYQRAIIVHAGANQADSKNKPDIWSFAYIGPQSMTTQDGEVSISISVVAESDPVGVMAHEAGHMLGLPDLYSSEGGSKFLGAWDVMSGGAWNGDGNSPAHPTSWCKMKLGWLSPENIRTVGPGDIVNVTVHRLETKSSSIQAIKIIISSDNYYLVEVRRKVGYDSQLPGQGVLILYVDESKGSGQGPVRLKDGDASTASLYDAAFQVGGVYYDSANGVRITIASTSDSSYEVRVEYKVADLDVAGISMSPEYPAVGDFITFRVTILNRGSADADEFIVNAHVDGEVLLLRSFSLDAGSSLELVLNWTATGGSHFITLIADTSELVHELSEENNRATKKFLAGYLLTVQTPRGGVFVDVDDAEYVSDLDGRVIVHVTPGVHMVRVDPIITVADEERRVFVEWHDGSTENPKTLAVDDDTLIIASFKTQFYLGVSSRYGVVRGEGWYDADTSAQVSASLFFDHGNGTRRVFTSWLGDTSSALSNATVQMDRPKNVSVIWRTQHEVSLVFLDAGLSSQISPLPSEVAFVDPDNNVQTFVDEDRIWMHEGVWTIHRVTWQSADITPELPKSIEVKAPQTWTLSCRVYDIRVKTEDFLGWPTSGALVSLRPANGTLLQVRAEGGEALFHMVPGGPYNVYASYLWQGSSARGNTQELTEVTVKFALSIRSAMMFSVVGLVIVCVVVVWAWRKRASPRG